MKAFYVVDRFDNLLMDTPFSTRERAELDLANSGLGERNGYFVREWELPDQEYYALVSCEALEDDKRARLLAGDQT